LFGIDVTGKAMTEKRDDLVKLDESAARRIMNLQGYGRNSLAKTVGRDPSEIGLWIRGKRRITLENANDIAKVLGCKIKHLTGEEVFHKIKDTDDKPVPGTPEFYARAIEGRWLANSHVAGGKDHQGNEIPSAVFEWEVELAASGNVISGTSICRTEGYEYGQFDLKGEVNGRGFLIVDGVRGIPDGADDVFRGLFQYHCDAKTRTMYGGYVMYWAQHQHIFEGHAILQRAEE